MNTDTVLAPFIDWILRGLPIEQVEQMLADGIDGQEQIYSITLCNPDDQNEQYATCWNIEIAKRYQLVAMQRRDVPPQQFVWQPNDETFRQFALELADIDESHLPYVNPKFPLIATKTQWNSDVIIDGWHRLVRGIQDGINGWAVFLLTPEQDAACRIFYHKLDPPFDTGTVIETEVVDKITQRLADAAFDGLQKSMAKRGMQVILL